MAANANRGAYYTPPAVARLIVAPALDRLLAHKSPGQPFAVLDPACGDGSLLVIAARRLFEWYRDRHLAANLAERCRIVRRHIYGVDIDPRAVNRARDAIRLLLFDGIPEPPAAAALDLSANIKCGDALLGPDFRGRRAFDWHAEFPQIMNHGGFDAVVGNPPWVSLAGRFGRMVYSAATVAYLTRRFGGNTYLPNLYEFFTVLGLDLTAPGGYLSLIVPDRLGFNQHLRDTRERILRDAHILSLQYRVPFPGVTADTLILLLRKVRPAADARVTVADDGRPSIIGPQSDLAKHPARVFRIAETAGLWEQMERAPGVAPLSEWCDSASGFGGRSAAIRPARSNSRQVPVLKGDSIQRYAVGKCYWFEFRRENLTGRTVDRAKLGATPKILLRKTGNRLIAAYDESGRFPEQSLYFLYNSRGVDLRFLLAILNSRLLSAYCRARLLTNAGSIAQVKKCDLDRLPIPRPDKTTHDRLVELVAGMMDCQRIKIDQQIEMLVRRMYGVAEEEHESPKAKARNSLPAHQL